MAAMRWFFGDRPRGSERYRGARVPGIRARLPGWRCRKRGLKPGGGGQMRVDRRREPFFVAGGVSFQVASTDEEGRADGADKHTTEGESDASTATAGNPGGDGRHCAGGEVDPDDVVPAARHDAGAAGGEASGANDAGDKAAEHARPAAAELDGRAVRGAYGPSAGADGHEQARGVAVRAQAALCRAGTEGADRRDGA